MAGEYYQLIIVDDEEQARRSLSKYCDWHQLGFHVAATLEDGSDAIAYLQNHPVDAILTDIQMFEVSGLELAQWVHEQHSDIRVVILSGYDEVNYVHAAIQSEAVDFLVKPVMKENLIRAFTKVRKKLDEQKAGRYSLRYLTDASVEEKENALARAAAGGDLAGLEAAYQAWNSALCGASNATVSALTARLIKNTYQRLENEGVLMPEEYGPEAAYRQLTATQNRPNPAITRSLLQCIAAERNRLPAQEDLAQRTKQWIAAHLSEDFSLEDICAALYVSKGHLCREFKRSANDTVMGYVEKQRMEKAAALLSRRRYSYAQLAGMVGYKDSHYFSKVFHKYMERRAAPAGSPKEKRP